MEGVTHEATAANKTIVTCFLTQTLFYAFDKFTKVPFEMK